MCDQHIKIIQNQVLLFSFCFPSDLASSIDGLFEVSPVRQSGCTVQSGCLRCCAHLRPQCGTLAFERLRHSWHSLPGVLGCVRTYLLGPFDKAELRDFWVFFVFPFLSQDGEVLCWGSDEQSRSSGAPSGRPFAGDCDSWTRTALQCRTVARLLPNLTTSCAFWNGLWASGL